MELTDSQKKKRAEKFLKHKDNPDLTTLESILELDEKLDDKLEEMNTRIDAIKEREDEIEVTLNIL